jgi:TAG lipase/steryl ester hydrolase/phospholipase A2/LPA acyltransferase
MTMLNKEMIYRAQIMTDWGIPRALTRGVSMFNQQYTGDVNILPEIEPTDYMFMMANPTPEFMLRSTRIGERATWPKMCRIKNSVAIEKALIRAINEFRDRVNFGPEAAKARQPVDGSNRGRSRTAGRKRLSFLRRRSLSNETSNSLRLGLGRGSGPPSPSPSRGMKRNSSVGSIMEDLWLGLTPVVTKPNILGSTSWSQ